MLYVLSDAFTVDLHCSLKSCRTISSTEDGYLRFLEVARLRCVIAADLVIERWGRGGAEAVGLRGGQELYSCGNQASLVPHGQQGIMVLLPQAPGDGRHPISVVLDLLFPLFDL